jgi:hypothetical protein
VAPGNDLAFVLVVVLMAVYVDDIFVWPVDCVQDPQARRVAARTGGRWCHMWADTPQELHSLAIKIGLRRAWAQKVGTPELHYDLTPSRRELAVRAGAIEKTTRDWLAMTRTRQPEPTQGDLFS